MGRIHPILCILLITFSFTAQAEWESMEWASKYYLAEVSINNLTSDYGVNNKCQKQHISV